jgi:hypothetical protein
MAVARARGPGLPWPARGEELVTLPDAVMRRVARTVFFLQSLNFFIFYNQY